MENHLRTSKTRKGGFRNAKKKKKTNALVLAVAFCFVLVSLVQAGPGDRKLKGYIHKGTVKTNGFVDPSQSITDTSKLRVLPSDDGFQLTDSEKGNFEWWYFDVIDSNTGCILKLVAHLGTDPLRRRFFPQVAISIRTPTKIQSFIRPYSLRDFSASSDFCDVRMKDEFHAFVESPGKDNLYHLTVNINGFSANLTFIPEIEGWKPLGDKVNINIGRKKGAFSWIIPVPRAKVVGEFSLGKEKYELKEAFGYHDHNYWKVDVRKKLFMDDVISKWYWGRFLSKDYTIIFMDTYVMGHPIKSLMIAKQDKIIHSSNNLIEVFADEMKKDDQIKTLYPSRITIKSVEENNPFQMILKSKEIIEKRDLLQGVNPFIKWLIKLLVAKPAYYGILAESSINIADEEIRGMALYEVMSFRSKN